MKRKIYQEMLEWKKRSNGRTALMLDGARRVGKSYIAEEFARNEYAKYLLIDFSKASAKVKRCFNEYLDDLDTFFMLLESTCHVELKKGESVVIFDEVQRFPRAREAIKHLVADGRYHYIETGSLISIQKNVKDILIPSEERHLEMFPMDFEEFLWAIGNVGAMDVLRLHMKKRKPLGEDMHLHYMDLYRQYLVVGGMPQAVAQFVETHNLREVDAIKRDILALYRSDIHKFGGAIRHKVLSVFNAIPSMLSKHEKRFTLAALSKDARMREYDAVFEWLKSAMTVNICYRATEPSIGLGMNADVISLKCYLGDTGLLVSQAFALPAIQSQDIHERLLSGRLSLNKGMIAENSAAQMLRASGHPLYFYSNTSRDSADDRMEVDFLVSKPDLTRMHNIIPIEVKSNKEYSAVSLGKFRRKYSDTLHTPVVLHPKDLKTDGGILYLPLYMTPLIAEIPS